MYCLCFGCKFSSRFDTRRHDFHDLHMLQVPLVLVAQSSQMSKVTSSVPMTRRADIQKAHGTICRAKAMPVVSCRIYGKISWTT